MFFQQELLNKNGVEIWAYAVVVRTAGRRQCQLGGRRSLSPARERPRGEKPDWVPVAYSPNDYIVYLDSAGVAWIVDTVGDAGSEKFADDGDALMARFAKGEKHGLFRPHFLFI